MTRCVRHGAVLLLVLAAAAQGQEPIIPPDAGLPVIDWKDAAKYIDKPVIVQGKIVQTKNIGHICFLNFDTTHTFTAVVQENCFKNFPKPPEQMYDQKIVRIRGVISEYADKPQITVSRPEQVTILEQAQPIPPRSEPKPRPFSGTVTIASYNVLNFFDEYDDPYHEDESTPPKPKEELEKLAVSIRALDADVLAMQEVENRGYLERFVRAMLGDMGYEHLVCFEGNDQRGIQCAVLSRLPVGPVTSHRFLRFDSNGKGPVGDLYFRRDVLQVSIEEPDAPAFCVFVVHLKSKRDGDATETYRVAEARAARRILDGDLRKDKDALFVICGDFNDTWTSPTLKALRGEGPNALADFLSDVPKDVVSFNKEPKGMIDFMLASPAMAKRYVPKSYRIVPGGIESTGSDHNPVTAKFELRNTKAQ
jgi:predicted extracellular nuclease